MKRNSLVPLFFGHSQKLSLLRGRISKWETGLELDFPRQRCEEPSCKQNSYSAFPVKPSFEHCPKHGLLYEEIS